MKGTLGLGLVLGLLFGMSALAEEPTEQQIERAAKIQASKNLKFRGWWDPWGMGPYKGDWDRAARELHEAGYNAVLSNMCLGWQSLYPSDLVPQKYKDDWLKICLEACQKHKLKFHVWLVCYNTGINVPKSHIQKLRAEGRLQKTVDGKEVDWLCPSDPRNVKHQCNQITEMLKKYPKIAGIHLDFIRYDNGKLCYCEGCRERFEKEKGKVANWPADVHGAGARSKEYNDWRKAQIRNMVVKARAATKKAKRTAKFSAAVWVGIWVDGIAQDWFPWVEDGLLDFVCPMDYTKKPQEFEKWVKMQQEKTKNKTPIYPGIAEWQNDRDGILSQIEIADKLGCQGYVLFKIHAPGMEKMIPVMKAAKERKGTVKERKGTAKERKGTTKKSGGKKKKAS